MLRKLMLVKLHLAKTNCVKFYVYRNVFDNLKFSDFIGNYFIFILIIMNTQLLYYIKNLYIYLTIYTYILDPPKEKIDYNYEQSIGE